MNTTQIAKMLQEFLAAFGFDAMAAECAAETNFATLQRYARIVLKNAPEAGRRAIFSRFALLGLV